MDHAVSSIADEIGIPNPNDKERARILSEYGPVVAAMIQAAAQDFHTAAVSGLIENCDPVPHALLQISDSIDRLKE